MSTRTSHISRGDELPSGAVAAQAGLGADLVLGPSRPGLLEAEDVAALLGVPRRFVYELVRRGELPAVRIGQRYVRFRSEALDEWIASRESSRVTGSRR